MTRIPLLIAAAAIVGFGFAGQASADSGLDSPTLQNENPSSCLGAERASRNSAGGDREKGGFGPEQADFVQTQDSYGQFLQSWKESCDYTPGDQADPS
ncbi:hypothetical protein [Halomonas tibetensis]|uniref:Uncharacterized protein n=1 Tax=Halomonas tibetensis TaxID=2259590 RepID=A0ABV7B385_9GAMM